MTCWDRGQVTIKEVHLADRPKKSMMSQAGGTGDLSQTNTQSTKIQTNSLSQIGN